MRIPPGFFKASRLRRVTHPFQDIKWFFHNSDFLWLFGSSRLGFRGFGLKGGRSLRGCSHTLFDAIRTSFSAPFGLRAVMFCVSAVGNREQWPARMRSETIVCHLLCMTTAAFKADTHTSSSVRSGSWPRKQSKARNLVCTAYNDKHER